jgi:hypothetical protein
VSITDNVKRLITLNVDVEAMKFWNNPIFGNPKISLSSKNLGLPGHNTSTDKDN